MKRPLTIVDPESCNLSFSVLGSLPNPFAESHKLVLPQIVHQAFGEGPVGGIRTFGSGLEALNGKPVDVPTNYDAS